jgi:TetR/AcrR family transcriptional regulator, fatty acid metabolism regulator protein
MTHGTDMAGLSERQRQIINASIKIIAEQSIQQLTIKNLSKRIGISEPAIYRHFESKIDILLAILDSFKETKNSIINKIAVDNMPALEKFEAIFTEHLKIFAANPALAAVIFSEEIFQNEKRLSETVFSIMKMNQQTHMDIIESAQKNKEIKDGISSRNLSVMIMGSLRLLVTRWRLSAFAFDLEKEGLELWHSIKGLIIKEA